jgi:hypothetical protein
MVRQGKSQSAPSDMLNFHFATSPPTQQSHMEERRRKDNRHPKQQQYSKRTDQDRASARKKAQTAMFYLHSSADHAFVLTRKSKQGYTFAGPDSTVSWESVRIVKYLVASTQLMDANQENCPVCLDTFSCARITKCGHCFCLPCLLRHVHTTTAVNPYQLVKCPCCALPVHVEDVRPVVMESIQPPKLHSRMKFTKLHRTKDCPAPFLPRKGAMKHSSPHACPLPTESDGAFSRFNYVDTAVYQVQLSANQCELEDKARELHAGDMELLFVQMSLETVRNEMRRALEETEEEQTWTDRFRQHQAGIYQPISRFLLARQISESLDHKVLENEPSSQEAEGSEGIGRFRGESMGSEGDRLGRPKRGYSIDSADSYERRHSRRPPRQLPHLQGSMYLEEGATQFYQASDGQICFLSNFNVQCLAAEFSINAPEEPTGDTLTALQRRKLQPLPDEIDGNVVEIQHVHLTPEMRKRIPCLSHLPVYTDAIFVELDLNRILSEETKQKFKGEFDKRRKRRKDKTNAEKREDMIAKQKEQERINSLKSRTQQIDPHDNFFQIVEPVLLSDMDFPTVTAGDKGISSPTTRPQSGSRITFSAIINTPSTRTLSLDAFPSLGSPALTISTSPPQPSWGRGWHAADTTPKSLEEDQLSTSPAQSSEPIASGKGKKSKGKMIHLFSTGGHRGY